jgi:hypothetical protein
MMALSARVFGSMTAAPIILATHQLVVTVGGFSGQDPAPTAAQLEQLVSSGQLRYVYGFGSARGSGALRHGRLSPGGRSGFAGGAFPGGGSAGAGAIPGGGASGGAPPAGSPPCGGAPAGGGTPGGGLPGAPGGLGGSASGARALPTWVAAHCRAVGGYSGLDQCSAA